jgi:ParB family transcriptional regulator, chromosome partitioning protein
MAMARRSYTDRMSLSAAPSQIQNEVAIVSETLIDRSLITTTFTFTPNGKPLRHYYDMAWIEEWAKSDLARNGILAALWVRPDPAISGKYELVAGMSRYLGAGIANITSIPVKVFPWNDEKSLEAAFSENANRVDFSVLEETEHLLTILCGKLKLEEKEVIALLGRIFHEQKGDATAPPDEMSIDHRNIINDIFSTYAQIKLSTFVLKRLNLLRIDPDVLNSIRGGDVSYSVGAQIATCKDPAERKELLSNAIQTKMTLTQVNSHLRSFKKGIKPEDDFKVMDKLKAVTKVIKGKELSIEKAQKITRLLEEIEQELTA